jgi:ATP-binding cassette, subfamily C (CFTR/MRP), member 1
MDGTTESLTPLVLAFRSREHTRAPSSGTSTPFPRTGDATPLEDEGTLVPSLGNDTPTTLSVIDDKLKRRKSYGRSRIRLPTRSRLPISEGIQQEHSEKGRVKAIVYRKYVEACSKSGFAMFIITVVFSQAFSILSNFALRLWSEDNRRTGGNGGITKYLALSGIAQLLSVFFTAIATVCLTLLCALRSSKQLHDNVSRPILSRVPLEDPDLAKMLNSLIHAPLSFFEQTPTGRYPLPLSFKKTELRFSCRILNVFSKDVYNIDQTLPRVNIRAYSVFDPC